MVCPEILTLAILLSLLSHAEYASPPRKDGDINTIMFTSLVYDKVKLLISKDFDNFIGLYFYYCCCFY